MSQSIRVTPLFCILFLVGAFFPTGATPVGMPTASPLPVWQRVPSPPENHLEVLATTPDDPFLWITGSVRNVYRSLDGGNKWESVFRLSGSEATIHRIAIHPQNVNHIFLLTSQGLFLSRDQGKNWQSSHLGMGERARAVYAVAFHPRDRSQMLIATSGGLLITQDGGHHWTEVFSFLRSNTVRDVLYPTVEKNRIYFLTNQTVGAIDTARESKETLFDAYPAAGFSGDEAPETSEESDSLRRIVLSPDGKNIAAVSQSDIFYAANEKTDWSKLRAPGSSERLNDVTFSADGEKLLAASESGAFSIDLTTRRAEELGRSMPASSVSTLAVLGPEEILAATPEGLLRLQPATGPWINEVTLPAVTMPSTDAVRLYYEWIGAEPAIHEVQQAATRYGHVDNAKIDRWHHASRMSALLPEFSVDSSWNENSTVDLDRGNTTDKDTFIVGPSENAFDWGLGLDWDLGELIWSSNQTSIDVREKLMVELREDLLREVTRIYFERRRRQQVLLMTGAAENAEAYWDHLFTIQELAGQMDALTGGQFQYRWRSPETFIAPPVVTGSNQVEAES